MVFADQGLADAVNAELGQLPGETITEAQAVSIESLSANHAGIEDLAGIEQLTGLDHLELDNNQLSDLSPITSLTGLTGLSLYENAITDVSALSVMTSLQYLYLDYNEVTDVTPLLSMTGLTELSLTSNGLADISPLSSMTGLTDLYLDRNEISDLSPLSGLTGLRSVVLYDNKITDLAPLTALVGLEGLFLSRNSINDLTPLSTLTGLRGLHLESNRISDLTPLSRLTELQALSVAENRITDASPLAAMIGLVSVTLYDQNATLAEAGVGLPTINPVRAVDGAPILVSSPDPDFTYDGTAHSWVFTGLGVKTLGWNASVTIGGSNDVPFTGALRQDVSMITPLVVPRDPVVVQAMCVDGEITRPSVTLLETDGIVYSVEGDIAGGATILVRAEALPGHTIIVASDTGWTTDSDGVMGTLTVAFDRVTCSPRAVNDPDDAPPAADVEDTPPAGDGEDAASAAVEGTAPPIHANRGELANTGAAQSPISLSVLVALAALAALVGGALVTLRRGSVSRSTE